MIILNITFAVQKDTLQEFEIWLNETKEQFQNKADNIQTYKILTQAHDDMDSYSFQIFLKNEDDLEVFRNINFLKIVASCTRKFGDKVFYFDSLLQSL